MRGDRAGCPSGGSQTREGHPTEGGLHLEGRRARPLRSSARAHDCPAGVTPQCVTPAASHRWPLAGCSSLPCGRGRADEALPGPNREGVTQDPREWSCDRAGGQERRDRGALSTGAQRGAGSGVGPQARVASMEIGEEWVF